MKTKKILLVLAAVLVITIPATVFAATSSTAPAVSIRHFFGLGVDTSKLTDSQKNDVSTYTQKMADLEKEFINKMVSNGTLTKEQGTAAIQKIDNALTNGTYTPNMSVEKGHRRGFGKGAEGMAGINLSTLTDAQKADFKTVYDKMDANEKDLINKLISAALITKAQGDAEIKRIEQQASNSKKGFMYGNIMRGFRGFGLDLSKLTNEQKAYFTDYNKKNIELMKELVNKAVSNNAITKAQGDTMLERIQNMPTDSTNMNFSKRMRGRDNKN